MAKATEKLFWSGVVWVVFCAGRKKGGARG
jgi:hypothetical protein